MRAEVLVYGRVLLPYPCPLRAESRGKATWRLGIQKERGCMFCYPSGALLASQMCVGRPQEGWILASPDNPSASSEVSFLVKRPLWWTQSVSKRHGNGKMPKAVHLCRSLSVGNKRWKPFGDLQFSYLPGIRNSINSFIHWCVNLPIIISILHLFS